MCAEILVFKGCDKDYIGMKFVPNRQIVINTKIKKR